MEVMSFPVCFISFFFNEKLKHIFFNYCFPKKKFNVLEFLKENKKHTDL